MPSFDAVLEPNLVELRNAVDQTAREIGTRFDFKGSPAGVALAETTISLSADSEFQLGQVWEILAAKLAKRGVDLRFVDRSAKVEKVGGDKVRQALAVKKGIDADSARKIQAAVKGSRVKAQAAIQGDVVRVSGAKRDELQLAIQHIRKAVPELPLTFGNFRD